MVHVFVKMLPRMLTPTGVQKPMPVGVRFMPTGVNLTPTGMRFTPTGVRVMPTGINSDARRDEK